MRNEVRLPFLIYTSSFRLIKKAAVLKKNRTFKWKDFLQSEQNQLSTFPFTKLNITYKNVFDLSYQITVAQRYNL